jgi:hypothetical protein
MNGSAQRTARSEQRNVILVILSSALFALLVALPVSAKTAQGSFFNRGMELYRSGRFSEAVDAFEQAAKRKDNTREAQSYIERIRKETVERIRNRALTGVNKASWQSKFFFMNEVDNRIRVGISVQEIFERDSTNFRSGALDALHQLGDIIAKAETARFDVELINEVNLDTPPNPTLTAQQLTTVFSYLSLASRNSLPRFEIKN